MKGLLIFIYFLFQLAQLGLCLDKTYEIKEFFDIIEKAKITEEESKKLIKNLKAICERYVYLDIAKNPPQPKDNYFNVVNLLDDLEKVNTETRPLYDFFRDVKMIINKLQDLHFDINVQRDFGSNIFLDKCYIISPVEFYVKNDEKKVYAVPTRFTNIFDPNIVDIIEANTKNPVKTIKGLDPFEYIQNFNKKFQQLKSPHAQFTYNLNMHTGPSLQTFPFIAEDLTNIILEYNTDTTVDVSYKIINTAATDSLFLKKYYNIPNNFNTSKNDIRFITPKSSLFEYLQKNDKNLKEVKWDHILDNGKLRCRVDTTNLVNVIFQNNFMISDLDKGYKFFDECFESFDNNNYPIIVIENFNGGGITNLASYLKHYLNLYKEYHIYEGFRYNEDVKNNVAKSFYAKMLKHANIYLPQNYLNLSL